MRALDADTSCVTNVGVRVFDGPMRRVLRAPSWRVSDASGGVRRAVGQKAAGWDHAFPLRTLTRGLPEGDGI